MIHDIRMLQETQHSQLLTHLCFNWRKIILPPGSQLDTGRLRLPLHLIAPLHGCLIRSPHMCLRWLVGMATQANGPPMDRTIVSSLHVQVFQPHGQWEYIYIYTSNTPSSSNVWVISPLHIIHSPQMSFGQLAKLFTCIGSIWVMSAGTVAWGFGDDSMGENTGCANSMAGNAGWSNNCSIIPCIP